VKDSFKSCLDFVLKHEGGWSDDPHDPGGATMKGVTLSTYKAYMMRPVTKEELRNISDEHLNDLYKTRYWDNARCDDLGIGVDMVVFDMAVNGGVGRSSRMLQRCVGADVDGAIGAKTIALTKGILPRDLVIRFSTERRNFYKTLETFERFGRGWLRRTDECEAKAFDMIGDK
jgi:lysozyme family protein